MGRRLLPLVIFLALTSLPLVAATPWLEVRSQHFVVVTDLSERQGEDVLHRFEALRTVFGTLFDLPKVSSPAPLQIVAFRSQDEFMPYVPRQNGKPISLGSFIQIGDDSSFIGLDGSSPDWQSAVAHDYASLLLRENFPVMPAWFEEGFAQYLGALKITPQQVEYGDTPSQFSTLLASSQWTPIVTVFAVLRATAAEQSGAATSQFQAESWLAVRYLLSNNKLADTFKYLQLAQIQKMPVAEAIEQGFGVDAATFEKQLRQSLMSNTGVTKSALPELHDYPYSNKKLTETQGKAVLADMHAHSDQYFQQALTELQSILKSDPNNSVANRALGYWYLSNNQPGLAEPPLQKASTTTIIDPQVWYLLGTAILRNEAQQGHSERRRMAGLQALDKAIDIDREYAAPRSWLALAMVEGGNFDAAIEAAKQAVALYPGAETYQAELAQVFVKAERWDSARAVLVRLQTSEDSKIRENATQTLASLEATREHAAEKKKEHQAAMLDPTAPQWKMTPDIAARDAGETTDDSEKLDTRKTLSLSAELQSVDCSHQPAAFVTVRKSQRTMRFYTNDYAKLMVMGADAFSCGWRDKRVLINYKPGGHADGDLVSLELQGK